MEEIKFVEKDVESRHKEAEQKVEELMVAKESLKSIHATHMKVNNTTKVIKELRTQFQRQILK